MLQARFRRRTKSPEFGSKAPVVNGFSSRIPATLQAIFLASNRGSTVEKPPPRHVANRAYTTHWSRTFNSKRNKAKAEASFAAAAEAEAASKVGAPKVPDEEVSHA